MWQNEIEIFGLKAYHNDEWHESDDEVMGIEDIHEKPKNAPVLQKENEMGAVTTNDNGDLQFEGGNFGDEAGAGRKQPGLCQRLLCCGGKQRQKRHSDQNERDWMSLTDE